MEFLSVEILILLVAIATIAAIIDAIAGGGGLLVLPALLFVGIPPAAALATNKLQGSFGTVTAMLNFRRQGALKLRSMLLPMALTLLGSAAGTLLIQHLDKDLLSGLIPILLLIFSLYFLFSPRVGDENAKQRISVFTFSITIGFGVGFYDGFFGPGTGSFFAFGYVALLGYNLRKATAEAKALNFTSNITSLLVFTLGGQIIWSLGLLMACGQVLGGYIGSHLVLKHGTALIRPMLVIISLIISSKLAWEQFITL